MRTRLAVALIAFLAWSFVAAHAAEKAAPGGERDDTVVFGLTATQLAIAAAVGAGVGAVAVVASGNTLAGAGLGSLAVIYVAHLVVEAVVVGGVYYMWPWEENTADEPAGRTAIGGAEKPAALTALRLAKRSERPTPAACRAC